MRVALTTSVLVGILLSSGCSSGSVHQGASQQVASDGSNTGATSGAAVGSAVEEALQDGASVPPQIVDADNAFGLALFNNLNQGASSNVAISPTSIALALQMVFNGAEGATQQGMSQALQLQGLGALAVDQDNAALQAALINPDPQVQVTIANSLWLHTSDTPVLPSFIDTNATYYAAEVGDLGGAPDNVNAWVASETKGLITQILPPANYSDVVAVLANAVYFKGAWTKAFDPAMTASAPFTVGDGTQVSCQMMTQTGTFPYLQGTDFQALELPYGQSGRLRMLIILPALGADLGSLIANMTSEQLGTWLSALAPANGRIGVPRFTATYGSSLVSALTTLGMGLAFNPQAADFSQLAAGVFLSDVEHKTLVQVDESGTVAAGATTITVSPTVVVASTFSMIMNRPFFYAIVDGQTGALLFIGTLVDPTQSSN